MKKIILLSFLLNFLFVAKIYAQDTLTVKDSASKFITPGEFLFAGSPRYTLDGKMPLRETEIRPVPAVISGGLFFGTMIALHYNEKNAWWSGQRRSFHFEEDWGSALQVDKFGHAFGGYIMSYGFSEVLIESGLNVDDATIYGSLLGMLYQSYVETEDGFASDWGFSPSDWYFDTFGAGYFLAQHYIPDLQNFVLKWQYVPSEWTGKPKIGRVRTFIDDYNSSTFWISANVHNLLPEKYKEIWPEWINLAAGYGADAIDVKVDPNGPPDQLSQRRYIIGLDFCMDKFLPTGGSFWNWWRQTLRMIKLPGPSVEFAPGRTKFFLLYPFRLDLHFMGQW